MGAQNSTQAEVVEVQHARVEESPEDAFLRSAIAGFQTSPAEAVRGADGAKELDAFIEETSAALSAVETSKSFEDHERELEEAVQLSLDVRGGDEKTLEDSGSNLQNRKIGHGCAAGGAFLTMVC